jgi:hypothetical protein
MLVGVAKQVYVSQVCTLVVSLTTQLFSFLSYDKEIQIDVSTINFFDKLFLLSFSKYPTKF